MTDNQSASPRAATRGLNDAPNSSRILDADSRAKASDCWQRYPTKQAALLPVLHLVHQRLGHVPPDAVVEIAGLLEMAPAQVQDALSFYGFFKQDKPQGRYRVWVCRSISCSARGGEDLLEYLCRKLGIQPGETTADGLVTLEFAECLGACDYAPAILVNDTLHEEMTKEKIDAMVEGWK